MFGPTLTALALALSAVAAPTAGPALSLKLAGPEAVDGVHNLKVTAVVTNTGSESVKLLHHPHSLLSKMPTNSFAISHTSGNTPKFTGAKYKYVPATAAKNTDASTFTVLQPGQSVEVEHDLSKAYDFSPAGEGKFHFDPYNVFTYVTADGTPATTVASVPSKLSTDVTGALAVTRAALDKRASFQSCSSSQQSTINSAASQASTYASGAYNYLSQHTSSTTRYTTWFGTYTSSRHSQVQSHYNNMISLSPSYSGYTYNCACPDADSSTYAYTYPDEYGLVYLCGAFWSAPLSGTDSKGGTLVHESSHFTRVAGTEDYVYGQSGAKSLAKSNPGEAVENADNHEYFAENNPSQS